MKITRVHPDSLGEMIGLKAGDSLLRINGRKVLDHIDYQFRMAEEALEMEFEIDGQRQLVEIEKEYDDRLGVDFEEFKIRGCANDCVFCFVDQNPKGMRSTMYFRDGDYRLSYLHGHYITMTNMGQNELNRIVDQRLSPLYISVHVTEPELRRKLFLYGKDDHLLEKLTFLTENGIELHSQVVLMPEVNDGQVLIRSLQDLYPFYPMLKTVSVVPVGLTGHRQGLMELKTVTAEYAQEMVNGLPELQQQFPGTDHPFVVLSDEWFILANAPFPPLSETSDFDLVENGVGQVSTFLRQFERERPEFPTQFDTPREFTILTGSLVNRIFQKEVLPVLNAIPGLTVHCYPIENNFYGTSVTVTGLLTGQDIVAQLQDKPLGEAVWATKRILNDEGTMTLDDMTLPDMSAALGVPVNTTDDSILEIFKRNIRG